MTRDALLRILDTRRRIEAIQKKRRDAVIRRQLDTMRRAYA